jgi:hypothetical protein
MGSGSALPHHMAVRAALQCSLESRPQGPTMHLLTSALAPVPHTPGILMGHPLQPFVLQAATLPLHITTDKKNRKPIRKKTTDKTRSLATLCYQFHAAVRVMNVLLKGKKKNTGKRIPWVAYPTHTRQHTRTRMCTRIPQKVHTHTHKKDALTHTLSGGCYGPLQWGAGGIPIPVAGCV